MHLKAAHPSFTRYRRGAMVLIVSLVAMLPLVGSPPAAAQASVVADVSAIVDALDAYAQDNGTFRTPAGYNNNGAGWFAEDTGSNYSTTIASVLVDGGYLADNNWDANPRDYFVRTCPNGRVAVMADATNAVSSEDLANWAGCPTLAARPYFQTSRTLTEIASAARAARVAPVIAALEAYAAANGTFRTPAGYNNNGAGWLAFDGTTRYTTSIASVLIAGGYLADDNYDAIPRELFVFPCNNGRVAVFARSDEPVDPVDAANWSGCNTNAITNQNRPYYEVSVERNTLFVPKSVTISAVSMPVGQTDVATVTVDPGTFPLGTMQVEVLYDPAVLTATDCTSYSGCHISEPGVIQMAGIRQGGWFSEFDLGTVTFERIANGASGLEADFVQADRPNGVTAVQVNTTVIGDANCDGKSNLADALIVTEFDVGIRTAETQCPLADQATTINVSGADINNSGSVSVVDALFIAQCSLGSRSNLACMPDANEYTFDASAVVSGISDDLSGVALTADGTIYAAENGAGTVRELTPSGNVWSSSIVSDPNNIVSGRDVEGITWISGNQFAVVAERRSSSQLWSTMQIVEVNNGTLSAVSGLLDLTTISSGSGGNKGLEGVAYAELESTSDEWIFYAVKEQPATLYRIAYNVAAGTASVTNQTALSMTDAAGVAVPTSWPTNVYVLSEDDKSVRRYEVDANNPAMVTEVGSGLSLAGMNQPEGIFMRLEGGDHVMYVVGEPNQARTYRFDNPG